MHRSIALAAVGRLSRRHLHRRPGRSPPMPDRMENRSRLVGAVGSPGFEWRTRGGRSMWTDDHRVADLPGLDLAQLRGQGGPVRFAMPRPAGRLDCSGEGGNGRGRGTCGFTADAGFANLLAAQGIGHAELAAIAEPGDERRRSSLDPVPRTASLACGRRSISWWQWRSTASKPRWFGSVARAKLPIKSVDDIVALRIHGADAAWIDGLATLRAPASPSDRRRPRVASNPRRQARMDRRDGGGDGAALRDLVGQRPHQHADPRRQARNGRGLCSHLRR